MRFFAPALFFGSAWYVRDYNTSHEQEKLLVPGLDLVPSLAGNIQAQAEWSPVVLAIVGSLFFAHALYMLVRSRASAAAE